MRVNSILGACVAGLQLAAAANLPQHLGSRHDKTEWVTESMTVEGKANHDKPSHKSLKGSKDSKDHKKSKHYEHKKQHPKGSKHSGAGDSKPKTLTHHKHPHKADKGSIDGGVPEHHKDKHAKEHKSKHDVSKTHKQPKNKAHAKGGAQASFTGYGGGPSSGSYQDQVVLATNVHRANHSAPQVTWSESLASTAQKIAEGCVFKHVLGTDGGGYGQNIAAGPAPAAISHVISNEFYNNEINAFGNQYGDPHPTGFEHWGHFSQLVWKNTNSVGCFTQHCPGGVGDAGKHVPPYFTVCNYHPPGNVAGQYGNEIGRPLGKATVHGV